MSTLFTAKYDIHNNTKIENISISLTKKEYGDIINKNNSSEQDNINNDNNYNNSSNKINNI